jgi:hypothetical protein
MPAPSPHSNINQHRRNVKLAIKSPVLTVSDILNQHSGGGQGGAVQGRTESNGVHKSPRWETNHKIESDGENRDVVTERPKRALRAGSDAARSSMGGDAPMSQVCRGSLWPDRCPFRVLFTHAVWTFINIFCIVDMFVVHKYLLSIYILLSLLSSECLALDLYVV